MRALGNVWNSMSEEGKEEWKNLSDADKARRVKLTFLSRPSPRFAAATPTK